MLQRTKTCVIQYKFVKLKKKVFYILYICESWNFLRDWRTYGLTKNYSDRGVRKEIEQTRQHFFVVC